MNSKTHDYLIVGGGLAGSTLAFFLRKKGKSVMLVDNPNRIKASKIAVGMFNPVVFRRLLFSWEAEVLLPFAEKYYREIEAISDGDIYFPKPYYKLFGSKEEEFWNQRIVSGDLGNYVTLPVRYPHFNGLKAPFGYGLVNNAGTLNIPDYLDTIHKLLEADGSIQYERFAYENLQITDNHFQYNSNLAKEIIFAEGWHMLKNPWFNYLPLRPTKGDVLTIEASDLKLDAMVNKNVFIVPLGNNLFRAGSTYNWKDQTEVPTEEGMQELIEKLDTIIDVPYKIVKHECGIRPASADRRMFIGEHPEIKNMHVFNGLGTKGVMLVPYFAEQFSSYLLDQILGIREEVSVRRFDGRFQKQKRRT